MLTPDNKPVTVFNPCVHRPINYGACSLCFPPEATQTCLRCGTVVDARYAGHLCRNPESMPPAPFYEPCARIDGGINILRNGEVAWESPDPCLGYSWENPAPNMHIDSQQWQDALCLCTALNQIEKDKS